jgi:hypothetical protein
MGLMSKLDAINEMLFNTGEQIVTSLNDDQNTDVNLAEFVLDQVTLESQLRGMAVNRRPIKVTPTRTGSVGHTVKPISDTSKGRIQLSPYNDKMTTGSLISAQLVSSITSNDVDVRITAAPRRFGIESNGIDYNILYNVTDNTDEWDLTRELTISIVEYVDFEDLETSVQKGIAAAASRQYQMFVQGDRDVDRLLAEKSTVLTAKGRAADANDKSRNIFASGDNAIKKIINRNANGIYDPSRFRFWRHRG